MREAIKALRVWRQTVLQRVKRGEVEAVHVTRGRQKESASMGSCRSSPRASSHHFSRGLARLVGAAEAGSSGQEWRG
jgi:hypothetical protein